MLKKRIALILATALVLTSVPLTERTANAEILPEIAADMEIASEAADADPPVAADGLDVPKIEDDQAGAEEPEYSEGDVIVCLKTDSGEAAGGNDEITNDKAGEIMSLLDGAEGLMDVTEAVKETDLYKPDAEQEVNGDDPVANDKSLPGEDDEYELKYIHSDKYSTQQLIDMLEGTPGVLFVEPNYIYHIAEEESIIPDEVLNTGDEAITEDLISEENEVTDISEEDSVEAKDINRDGTTSTPFDFTDKQYAYGNGTGGMDVPYWNTQGYKNAENTVVAVLDTGVDYNHEDLKEVMWDEGLLYPELTALGGGQYGYNATYNSYDPMDKQSHGTHCAGIVGAPWNGIGVSGTANGTKIMAVRASYDAGGFPTYALLRGFNYVLTARQAGVNVVAVNNSWGGIVTYAFALATKELEDAGVICCFASGNEMLDIDKNYLTATVMRENEGIISVDAGRSDGELCFFSNYGVRTTDLSAPGGSIISSFPSGKGSADPRVCAPMIDEAGREMRDLFDGDDRYFTYKSVSGSNIEFINDGGQKALAVTGMTNLRKFLSISCNRLNERPEYIAISGRYGLAEEMVLYVYVHLNNGEYKKLNPRDRESDIYSSVSPYKLPDDMNLEEPEIILEAKFRTGKNDNTYYINGISFTNENTDYSYMSGTSMATPAVTGEVAVVASKWPGDSVARRAARVIGSTKPVGSLAGTSRTGGIANVRKALDCDYAPVVNKAWVDDDGLINVAGYFFGDEKGSVSLISKGSSLEGINISEWSGQDQEDWDEDGDYEKNKEDIIKLDPGSLATPVDEIMITVTSSEGETGSRMLTITGQDDSARRGYFYEKLPMPGSDNADMYNSFLSTTFTSATGQGGYIYYAGYEYKKETEKEANSMWRYTISGNTPETSWKRIDRGLNVGLVSNICAWNKMLVYLDEKDFNIKMYSPEDDNLYDPGICLPDDEDVICSNVYIVNAENDLYFLMTLGMRNTEGSYVDKKTNLYRIDVENGKIVFLKTLESIQKSPVVWTDKDGTGNTYLYSMAKKDDTNIVRENILIKGDSVSSETEDVKLPAGCSFDSEKLNGAMTQYGIVLAGPADKTDLADNFLYNPADKSIKPCVKKIDAGRPGNLLVTEYKGKTYFLCMNMYMEEATLICADNDEFKGEGEESKQAPHDYGDDKVMDVVGTDIVVDLNAPNNGNVPVGKTCKVTPAFTDKGGNKISYTWYSEDAAIALVDQSGKVTGKAVGSTVIHATGRDGNGNRYEGYCDVNVYPQAKSIKLSATKLTVAGGDEFTIRATLTPEEALKDKVEWSLSIPASYPGAVIKTGEGSDENGCYATFKTKDAGENVQVKVTASLTDGSKKKASCTVTVVKASGDSKVPVKSAALSETGTIYLGAGMEHKVSLARVLPENCSDYTVDWKSSDESAVTLSVNDLDASYAIIKGEKKGSAKITAEITNTAAGGKKIIVKGLTVKVVQSSLSGNSLKIFNKKKDITETTSGNRLAVGKKVTLKATAYKDGSAIKAGKTKVIWTSDDPEIATVVNGKVKAYREGEVTLMATLVPVGAVSDGSYEPVSASCTFYVYNPVKKIRIDRYDVYEQAGELHCDLIKAGIGNVKIPSVSEAALYLRGEGITSPTTDSDSVREDKYFDFVSSKPSVISIDEDETGCVVLTPKAAGKSTITVTATDGSKKKTKFTVTVYNQVSGIRLTAASLGKATVSNNNTNDVTVSGLATKKTFKIKPIVEPAKAANKTVTYVSTNPKAVTVNKNGLVKRVSEGEAYIYVTTVDGGYIAVCHVK